MTAPLVTVSKFGTVDYVIISVKWGDGPTRIVSSFDVNNRPNEKKDHVTFGHVILFKLNDTYCALSVLYDPLGLVIAPTGKSLPMPGHVTHDEDIGLGLDVGLCNLTPLTS